MTKAEELKFIYKKILDKKRLKNKQAVHDAMEVGRARTKRVNQAKHKF